MGSANNLQEHIFLLEGNIWGKVKNGNCSVMNKNLANGSKHTTMPRSLILFFGIKLIWYDTDVFLLTSFQ